MFCHLLQTKTRLEVCPEVLQHPEGSFPIMHQSERSDVWDAARRHADRLAAGDTIAVNISKKSTVACQGDFVMK